MFALTPKYFFDLSSYRYASIFAGCSFVWEVIPRIALFLKEESSLGNIEVKVPQGTFLIDSEKISIGKGTVIEPGAYIKGPCIIGEHCTVRHGAYIRGNFISGNHCTIGHDTEIKNVLMLNNVQAAHFAYLGDCILGNHVNLGAGTKCANLKLDHKEINLHYQGHSFRTGLKKLGAIIGDGAQLGCNAVTNPGTLLGQNVRCYPCTNLGGFVESNCVVKMDSKVIIRPFHSSQ